jgi:hypothetical protein
MPDRHKGGPVKLRLSALICCIALLAAACGDDDATITSTTGAAAVTTTAASTTTAGPTATTSGGVDIGPMIRFGSGDHPFAISFPEDWENERDSFGAVIIMFSPLSGDTDQFAENVNVVVEDLAGADLDLDGYVEIATEQLLDFIPDIDFVERFTDQMDEEPSWVIVYTGTQDGIEYKWMQEVALFEGSAYIITYTGAAEFDTYRAHASAIFDSFDFND